LDPAEQETSKADDVDLYADEDSRMNWLRWVTTLGLQSCDNRAVDALLKDEASVEAFYNFLAAGEGQEGENRCAVFYLEDATSDFGINSAPPPEQSAASESLEGEAVDENAAPAASVEDAANPNEASSSNAPAEVQQSEAASADAEPGAESETAAGANSNEGGESAIPESDATVDPEPAAVEAKSPLENETPVSAAPKESLDIKALRVRYNSYPETVSSTNERLVIIRNSSDALAVPSDRQQARVFLNGCLTPVLVLTQTLPTRQLLLNEVYLPIILQNLRNESANKQAIAESIKSEFTSSLLKFSSQLTHACQHVGGDVSLDIPIIDLERSIEDIKGDSVAIGKMEAALHHWTPIVSQLLTREAGKTVVGKGPMAEVDYWRERASAFSSVFEQLSTPYNKKLLAVMREAVENSAATFDVLYSDLTKM
jgi:dynein heavy chain